MAVEVKISALNEALDRYLEKVDKVNLSAHVLLEQSDNIKRITDMLDMLDAKIAAIKASGASLNVVESKVGLYSDMRGKMLGGDVAGVSALQQREARMADLSGRGSVDAEFRLTPTERAQVNVATKAAGALGVPTGGGADWVKNMQLFQSMGAGADDDLRSRVLRLVALLEARMAEGSAEAVADEGAADAPAQESENGVKPAAVKKKRDVKAEVAGAVGGGNETVGKATEQGVGGGVSSNDLAAEEESEGERELFEQTALAVQSTSEAIKEVLSKRDKKEDNGDKVLKAVKEISTKTKKEQDTFNTQWLLPLLGIAGAIGAIALFKDNIELIKQEVGRVIVTIADVVKWLNKQFGYKADDHTNDQLNKKAEEGSAKQDKVEAIKAKEAKGEALTAEEVTTLAGAEAISRAGSSLAADTETYGADKFRVRGYNPNKTTAGNMIAGVGKMAKGAVLTMGTNMSPMLGGMPYYMQGGQASEDWVNIQKQGWDDLQEGYGAMVNTAQLNNITNTDDLIKNLIVQIPNEEYRSYRKRVFALKMLAQIGAIKYENGKVIMPTTGEEARNQLEKYQKEHPKEYEAAMLEIMPKVALESTAFNMSDQMKNNFFTKRYADEISGAANAYRTVHSGTRLPMYDKELIRWVLEKGTDEERRELLDALQDRMINKEDQKLQGGLAYVGIGGRFGEGVPVDTMGATVTGELYGQGNVPIQMAFTSYLRHGLWKKDFGANATAEQIVEGYMKRSYGELNEQGVHKDIAGWYDNGDSSSSKVGRRVQSETEAALYDVYNEELRRGLSPDMAISESRLVEILRNSGALGGGNTTQISNVTVSTNKSITN